MNKNWFPGCGRPHPNSDLIKRWAEGTVKTVLVERAGMKAVEQQFPTWHPEHNYQVKEEAQEWIRAFIHDGAHHHVTCKAGGFVHLETLVYREYGPNVQWLHEWVMVSKSAQMTTNRAVVPQQSLFHSLSSRIQ